ncbi:GNAT family N-acetyltransferase [Vulgatibacter incomptus]|uniref:Ribosomal-protein-S18p-alanine acetyltransferase n=1 Tax=Vulgatibacter incomptus TaxID=1391653 RepID=A0A0K1PGN5_9BACT|nr:GNAT family N-acetyltransferase [Vulgatibacter incomptus]AKU92581.1 Ribosomal-protein-S18p-alanine acetyltransferase [Vulgatibacter incomptus]
MDFASTADFSLRELSTLFARAFEGYFVPWPDDPALLDARIRGEAISLVDSRVAIDAEGPAALLLVSRRGRESRLAAMGITPAFRGRGIGRELLARLLDEARARGDVRMRLEVIESNEPAVRLYRSAGFTVMRRLVGFSGLLPPEPAQLEEVEPRVCAALLPEGLPWQLEPASIEAISTPSRAFRLGPAVAVVGASAGASIRIRAIAVEPSWRGQGAGCRLLRALAALHPDGRVELGAIFPEGLLDGFLAKNGFSRTALSQLEMEWLPPAK